MLDVNTSTVLSAILVGEIEKFDPDAPQNINDRWQRNIDAYWAEKRKFKNIIKSPEFWLAFSDGISFRFNTLSSPERRESKFRATTEKSKKIVMDAKYKAIQDYLEAHPDIAKRISIPEPAKALLRPMLEKQPVPGLQPYLGL
jgi:hypothetical protein